LDYSACILGQLSYLPEWLCRVTHLLLLPVFTVSWAHVLELGLSHALVPRLSLHALVPRHTLHALVSGLALRALVTRLHALVPLLALHALLTLVPGLAQQSLGSCLHFAQLGPLY
jgi:hypothetical protein